MRRERDNRLQAGLREITVRYVQMGEGNSETSSHYKPGTVKGSWASSSDAEIHIFPAGDS